MRFDWLFDRFNRYHGMALCAVALAVVLGSVLFGSRFRASDSPLLVSGDSPVATSDESAYAEVSTASDQSESAAAALPLAASTSSIDVPILVYHIVRPSYPSDSKGVKKLAQTPEVFDAEMKYLSTAGYHVVRLSDLERYFKDGTPLPPHPVIITFDDGWKDQFTYAFPIIEKYHYPVTFFVFTNAIGRPAFFSWDDLSRMIAAGMSIGSHSESHPFLTRITDQAKLWDEINGSKQILESKLGITVNEFAYPFGQYNQSIISMVAAAGYVAARGDVYSGLQSSDHEYALSAINAATTLAKFQQQLPSHQ